MRAVGDQSAPIPEETTSKLGGSFERKQSLDGRSRTNHGYRSEREKQAGLEEAFEWQNYNLRLAHSRINQVTCEEIEERAYDVSYAVMV